MTGVDVGECDHEPQMSRAIEPTREAADGGDRPFRSDVVRNGTITMSESNRVNTKDDIRLHPERRLACRACRENKPAERAETVMYPSPAPWPMCAGGMVSAGFEWVVYSESSPEIAELGGVEPSVRQEAILDSVTEVIGPVLNDERRQAYVEFD